MASAGLRCGMATIKYLLFIVNFLFSLVGLGLVVTGALCIKYAEGAPSAGKVALILVIVLGVGVFLVSFFGCCGAIKESHCMLVTFAAILMIVVVVKVIAAVMLFVNMKTDVLGKSLSEVFDLANSDKPGHQEALSFVNFIQRSFKCCGVTGPTFWGHRIPGSCCGEDTQHCSTGNLYNTGCRPLFAQFMDKYGRALGGVFLASALVELIGVWFSLALAGEIKKSSR